jgi:hypothetical protein
VFDIGPNLRAARTARGFEIADAEELTCLRARHLVALEDERFDDLPGRAYARAFLRSYAGTLGLDADMFVDEFEERFPEPQEEPEPPAPEPRLQLSASTKRAIAIGCVVAGLAAIVAWTGTTHHSQIGPGTASAETAPPAPAPMPHPRALAQAAPAKPAGLVLRATRGASWLLIRRGSETGPILYEGTLQPGRSLHFESRVWIRLGAPWNVDATRGGRAVPGVGGSGATPVNVVA